MPFKFRKSLFYQQMEIIETTVNDFKVHIKFISGTTFDNMLRLEVVPTLGVLSFEIHYFLLKNQSSLLFLTPPC